MLFVNFKLHEYLFEYGILYYVHFLRVYHGLEYIRYVNSGMNI